MKPEEKVYSIKQIKEYAKSWLKSGFCTDGKDNIPENERLSAFIYYIDAEDSDNIDNYLSRKF
jgi:hypothetical protein